VRRVHTRGRFEQYALRGDLEHVRWPGALGGRFLLDRHAHPIQVQDVIRPGDQSKSIRAQRGGAEPRVVGRVNAPSIEPNVPTLVRSPHAQPCVHASADQQQDNDLDAPSDRQHRDDRCQSNHQDEKPGPDALAGAYQVSAPADSSVRAPASPRAQARFSVKRNVAARQKPRVTKEVNAFACRGAQALLTSTDRRK
jgi:hypothetical protein